MNILNLTRVVYFRVIRLDAILHTTLLGLFFGTFGTTIGGILGAFLNKPSSKMLSFILQFAAGLMISIICFDLIPEALEISNIVNTIFRSTIRCYNNDIL